MPNKPPSRPNPYPAPTGGGPSAHAGASAARRRKGRVAVLGAVLALLVVGVVAGSCYLLWQQLGLDRAARAAANTPLPEAVSDTPMGLAENPVDFAALQARNPDVFAWVCIPGTNVNYPVLRRPSDDAFYLNHNIDGDHALEGSIYAESVNAADFSDPVTLLYGHYLTNGTMFSSLHEFRDPAFFDEHDTLYVYTPGRALTYRIAAAFEYDDRHIVKTNDFSNPAVVDAYFASVTSPESEASNVRDGVRLAPGDKIVQLSTCTSPTEDTPLRYIVTGVLVDEQKTS